MFFKRDKKQNELLLPDLHQSSERTVGGDTSGESSYDSSSTTTPHVSEPQKGFRHLGKNAPKIFIGLGLVVAVILAVGLFNIFYSKTYKIGSKTFTSRDIANMKSDIKRSRHGKEASGGRKASVKEAEDRVVLLAALKSEADKYKVPYDEKTINGYIDKEVYSVNGGKKSYLAYVKSAYNWGEAEIFETQSIEYLKSQLQKYVLQNRSYTVIYSRWDNFRLLKGVDVESATKEKQDLIAAKFLQPMQSGMSSSELANLVDIKPGMTSEEVTKVYAKSITPVHMVIEYPGQLKYDAYKIGENPAEKFLSLKKVGDVVGPFKSSDGRLILARLEHADAGQFANWDDFLMNARKESGVEPSAHANDMSLSKKLSSIWQKLAEPFTAKSAYAKKVSCWNENHPVTLTIRLVDSVSGLPLPGEDVGELSASASATRYFGEGDQYNTDGGCIASEFPAALCSLDPANPTAYATASCLIGWHSDPVTVRTVDCMGGIYTINPPTIPGYDYVPSDISYTNGNGGRATIDLKYKQKANTQNTTCDLRILDTATADKKKIRLETQGPVKDEDGDDMEAELTSNRSQGKQTMELPNSTSDDVVPSTTQSTTYTVTIYKKTIGGTRVTSCDKTVIPGSTGSIGCTVTGITGDTTQRQGTYTVNWSINGSLPSGYSVWLDGDASDAYPNVTGLTSWNVWPRDGTAASPATTTYRIDIKSGSTATSPTVTSCSGSITIGGSSTTCNVCGCPGYPACDYITEQGSFECKVNIWVADLTKPDKKGQRVDLGSNKVLSATPGQQYVVEPDTQDAYLHVTYHYNGPGGSISSQDIAHYDPGNYLKSYYKISDGFSSDIPYEGKIMQFDTSGPYNVGVKDANSSPPPYYDHFQIPGNPYNSYISPEVYPFSFCFQVEANSANEPCRIGVQSINIISNKLRNIFASPFDRLPRYQPNKNLLKLALASFDGTLARPFQYGYSVPREYGNVTGLFTYPGGSSPGTPNEGAYKGQILTWSYGSLSRLQANDVVVAVVFDKNGQPIYKGVPLPSESRGYNQPTTPPPVASGIKGGGVQLPYPLNAVSSNYKYVSKELAPTYAQYLPNNTDVIVGDGTGPGDYQTGEHWFDMAIPVEGSVADYTVKMYKVNLSGATATDNLETRFDAIAGSDGVPDDPQYYVAGCGASTPSATRSNRPYIKAEGADIYSGISFLTGDQCVATSQAKNAAIKTNGYSGDRGFSGTELAAFASGEIGGIEPNIFLGNNGYVRNPSYNDLLFANDIVGDNSSPHQAGKYYGNDTTGPLALPCISIDKEALKNEATTVAPANVAASVQGGSGVLYVNGDASLGNISDVIKNKTLLVEGTLQITGNITYATSSSNLADLPHLKIIAKNIYIKNTAPAPIRIDAELVAYPTAKTVAQGGSPDLENGIIDTCADSVSPGTWGQLKIDSCNRQLVVNGSLTALNILWKGTRGTVGGSQDYLNDTTCNGDRTAVCAAEYIKYSPELYLSKFNSGSTSDFGTVLNSTELPPAY